MHKLSPKGWWEEEEAFPDGFEAVENVSFLGWLDKPGMVEGNSELAWLGSHHDLLSKEALKALSQGTLSQTRLIKLKWGKMVDKDQVYGKN